MLSEYEELCDKLIVFLARNLKRKIKPAILELFKTNPSHEFTSLDIENIAGNLIPDDDAVTDFIFKHEKKIVGKVKDCQKKIASLQNDIQTLTNKLNVTTRKTEANRKQISSVNVKFHTEKIDFDDKFSKFTEHLKMISCQEHMQPNTPLALNSACAILVTHKEVCVSESKSMKKHNPLVRHSSPAHDGHLGEIPMLKSTEIQSSLATSTFPEKTSSCLYTENAEVLHNLKSDVENLSGELKHFLASTEEALYTQQQFSRKCSEELKCFRENTEEALDGQQQYTRSNILGVKGVKYRRGEDTSRIVLDIFHRMGLNVSPSSIDRSHRNFGKPNSRGYRNPPVILVKFVAHDVKDLVYFNRDRLRNIKGLRYIFIDENLTKVRHEIFREVRSLPLDWESWTYDGKICLRHKSWVNRVTKITTKRELLQFYDIFL